MDWNEAVELAVSLRHWFHQYPELTWQEANTADRIRQCLTEWEIEWRPCATYGTVAIIASEAPGKHIAFRADMDALPIEENSTVPFCSTIKGKMHACGHDGHMAALLGTARWLKTKEAELPGPVSLVFQPAEEGGHGAEKMIEDGALDGIDEIYGWHNWPAMPFGVAVCPDGAVMSGNGSFDITIQGKGGHASQPEACRDPVLAAAAMTLNLQQIVSRRLPPQAAAVVSVTAVMAESSFTIIPESVRLAGGFRFSDPKWCQPIEELISQIADDTASSYGVAAKTETRRYYGATINHSEAAQNFRGVMKSELGDGFDHTEMMLPIMASEDFSYFLQKVPGAFALIGMSEIHPDSEAYHYPCHSPKYEFNDKVLEMVMRFFTRLAGLTPPKYED